ncbi:hypothetical protein PG993_013136 [Apiospora rasikravindrae]|uniref:Uncharacterized protein n=1 Tax=Apiospora rasikravindrae TaxID=990691 RepID=A0ABR1RYV3_9PEZI
MVRNAIFFDAFIVRGHDFHDDMIGPDGIHLRNQLKGCGAITGWGFVYNPDKKKTKENWHDWTATFNQPLGQGRCVGHAIQSVGGQNVQCQ